MKRIPFDQLREKVGYVTDLQVEGVVSEKGPQILVTIKSDDDCKVMKFWEPISEDNLGAKGILRLLTEALLHQRKVRIMYVDTGGSACRIAMVRIY